MTGASSPAIRTSTSSPPPRGVLRAIARRFSFRRFGRDRRGATVVEFALVALPFFALMMAILESGLLFFATQTLERAVDRGGRLVRTGQAQNYTPAEFKEAICESMIITSNCEANLRVDVRTYDDFESINLADPIDDEGNLEDDDFGFEPGVAGQIVVVRAFYEWPIYTNFLGLGLANLANGSHLIVATSAFRNEPF